ncbi:hypothetical protein [Exiguobacterium sp. s166]|nr:hypothetical protein [Exiguobacterium sp. s166]
MSILEMFDVMNQAKGKQVPDKVTLIDAQLRFVESLFEKQVPVLLQ